MFDSFDIFYVYILASKRNGTLYTGVTNNVVRRVIEHRLHYSKGFAEKYRCSILVYFETHNSIIDAIAREKAIKKWRRNWKIAMIEEVNKNWSDLLYKIVNQKDLDEVTRYVERLIAEKNEICEKN